MMVATTKDLAKALSDVSAYPLQVSDVQPGSAARGDHGEDLDRLVDSALRAVLGTRTRIEDVDRFRAALGSSFVAEEVDGHRQFVPVAPGRLVGGSDESTVSGPQAVLLGQAKDVVDRALPLLDRLMTLRPSSDPEDQAALSVVIRTAIGQLRTELGRSDGPRVPLVDEQLRVLLGTAAASTTVVDPDGIGGALGALRDLMGLNSSPVLPLSRRNGHPGNRANTPAEEESLTHYRMIADSVLRLDQSWRAAAGAFTGDPTAGYSFITGRLQHLDLTLQTIGESVSRVRDALDSVYIGPAERRILVVPLKSRPRDRLTVEDLLTWADDAVGPETSSIARDHGRIALAEYVLPNTRAVAALLKEAATADLGGGFSTPRVTAAFAELVGQYDQLVAELQLLVPPAGAPGTATGQLVDVPDVVDDPVGVALATLRGDGLEPEIGTGRTVESGPLDRVLTTSPQAGETVARGTTVTVDYATALARALVPDLRGLQVAEARDALHDAELAVDADLKHERDPDVRIGCVIRSVPPHDRVVDLHTPVKLVVSFGDTRDWNEILCQLAPAVGSSARDVWSALGELWSAVSGHDDDCPAELRDATVSVGSVVEILQELTPDALRTWLRRLLEPPPDTVEAPAVQVVAGQQGEPSTSAVGEAPAATTGPAGQSGSAPTKRAKAASRASRTNARQQGRNE
jgi:hypothetical protein